MQTQYSNVLILIGGSLLLIALWAASIGFVYWDVNRRGLPRFQKFGLLVVAILLPFLGFLAYLFAWYILPTFSQGRSTKTVLKKRQTMPMRVAQNEVYLPTIAMSADAAQPPVPEQSKPPFVAATSNRSRRSYILRVIGGPAAGNEFVVTGFPVWIGRGPEATIRLDADRSVSRQQAEIYEKSGWLYIRDLNSSHGTQVNGNWIADQLLEPGDELKVGVSTLLFEERGGA
jgi:hypothetical protein